MITLESYICHPRFEFQQHKTSVSFTNTGVQYIPKLLSRSLFDFNRSSSWINSILHIKSQIKLVKSSYWIISTSRKETFLSYRPCPLLYRSFSVSGGSIYSLILLLSVLLGFYVGSGLLCLCLVDYFPLSLLSGSKWSD